MRHRIGWILKWHMAVWWWPYTERGPAGLSIFEAVGKRIGLLSYGITLGMGSANERRCYNATPPPIARAHTQNDLWLLCQSFNFYSLRALLYCTLSETTPFVIMNNLRISLQGTVVLMTDVTRRPFNKLLRPPLNIHYGLVKPLDVMGFSQCYIW